MMSPYYGNSMRSCIFICSIRWLFLRTCYKTWTPLFVSRWLWLEIEMIIHIKNFQLAVFFCMSSCSGQKMDQNIVVYIIMWILPWWRLFFRFCFFGTSLSYATYKAALFTELRACLNKVLLNENFPTIRSSL